MFEKGITIPEEIVNVEKENNPNQKHGISLDNKEYHRKYNKEWYRKNKEKKIQSAKEYYKRNSELIKRTGKEYYNRNKSEIIEKQKQRNLMNLEHLTKYRNDYYIENKSKIIAKANIYVKRKYKEDKDFKKKVNLVSKSQYRFKPIYCFNCNSNDKLNLHHYTKEYQVDKVVGLCCKCHKMLHKGTLQINFIGRDNEIKRTIHKSN